VSDSPLKKVEHFSELGPGMRLVIKNNSCHHEHTGITVKLHQIWPAGQAWEIDPRPTPCLPLRLGLIYGATETGVREGNVYRFIDYDPAAERAEDEKLKRAEKSPTAAKTQALVERIRERQRG
jgi:hypothetical protein